MTERLRHRGPDGDGVWAEPGVALGHRRLSILDLSHAADQPMVWGAHVLTYNGEIYNHRALRAELPGPWRSTGDTEVLLHLLARDGRGCLGGLAGMFAFGCWDAGERRLLLVRDRLGIKPLYYRILPDGIAFASELKALLVLGTPADRCERRARLPVSRLHAGAEIDLSRHLQAAGRPRAHLARRPRRIERYWRPSSAVVERTAADTLTALDELLREVVPAHTLRTFRWASS